MLLLGPLAFLQPWVLTALFMLPALWWLLRLLPPAPRSIPFPAIRLLFGLSDEETTPRAAPWWLTLLRLSLAALLIVAVARPVLNPDWALEGNRPVLVVVDDGWASAPRWEAMTARADMVLAAVERARRPVYFLTTAPPSDGGPVEPAQLVDAATARALLGALVPKPWPVDRAAAAQNLAQLPPEPSDVFWFADGIASNGDAGFSQSLSAAGAVTVFRADSRTAPLVLVPPIAGDARLVARVLRPQSGSVLQTALIAYDGAGRALGREEITFAEDQVAVEVDLNLPLDLRNAVARIALEGESGVSRVVLLDDRYSRRPIGIITNVGAREALPLLSEVFFLDRAMQPLGTIDRGPTDILLRQPQSMMLLPDETVLETGAEESLRTWITQGGILVRFAGPRLANAIDDGLVPVALRGGGRQLSGAMLWTEPARIGEIAESGPLAGMHVRDDISITRQVLAEPSLELDRKTWLRLEDDTPLITADRIGDGWLVLFHTSANTQWSNLALSGFFVEALARLSALGGGVRDASDAAGLLAPYRLMDGMGQLVEPDGVARALNPGALEDVALSAAAPPGYYGTEKVRVAVNLGDRVPVPSVLETPVGARVLGLKIEAERPLLPYLLIASLVLLLIDTALTAWMRGFAMLRPKGASTLALVLFAGLTIAMPDKANAQTGLGEIPQGALFTTLAFVITGDPAIDDVSLAGLTGLSDVLRRRTAVEAGEPVGVDLEKDELAFYPLLYWPISEGQARLSAGAADRLNRFMAGGGVILFDTRDGYLSGGRFQLSSDALRQLSRQLTIPPISAVPPNHVLTRSFYLMQDFPGRWQGGTVWVETEGSTSNDGVSPVLVGDADWAAAWAIDEQGRPLLPITENNRQREMALRFGVNLVMYTLTGNYKADQVHIPSILERLGQ